MEILQNKALFWDVEAVDPEKHGRFVVERILSFGDVEDFRWARRFYGDAMLKQVVRESRNLDKKSRSFWCGYFRITPEVCTKKPLMQIPSAFSQRLPAQKK